MAGCSPRADGSSMVPWPRRSRRWARGPPTQWRRSPVIAPASRSNSPRYHALRGEVWDKALRYCGQAGAKAAGRVADREAVAFFEQALATLENLPETQEMRSMPSTFSSICATRSRCSENCREVSIAFAEPRRWRKPWAIERAWWRSLPRSVTTSGPLPTRIGLSRVLGAALRSRLTSMIPAGKPGADTWWVGSTT